MSQRARSWVEHDAEGDVAVAGVALVLDPAGALYWPEERALVVADLHLEKGSSFAARGVLLPPYDTAATLARLAQLIARYAPRLVMPAFGAYAGGLNVRHDVFAGLFGVSFIAHLLGERRVYAIAGRHLTE